MTNLEEVAYASVVLLVMGIYGAIVWAVAREIVKCAAPKPKPRRIYRYR